MLPNVVVFFWLGSGAGFVAQTFIRVFLSFGGRCRSAVTVLLLIYSFVCVHVGYFVPQNTNYDSMDQSLNFLLRDKLRVQMEAFPLESIVILRGDHVTNVMRYIQTVEGVRPDLNLLSDQLVKARWFKRQEIHYPSVTFPERRYNEHFFGFALQELIEANIKKKSIFACNHLVTVHPQNVFVSLPFGLCDQIHMKTSAPQFDMWWNAAMKIMPTGQNYTDNTLKFPAHTWEYKLIEKQFEKQQKMAADAVTYAQLFPPQSQEHDRILLVVKRWIQNITEHQVLIPFKVQFATFKNLAVSYLTRKDSLNNEEALRGGLLALLNFLKVPEARNDKQFNYITDSLLPQVVSILHTKFSVKATELKELGAPLSIVRKLAEGTRRRKTTRPKTIQVKSGKEKKKKKKKKKKKWRRKRQDL